MKNASVENSTVEIKILTVSGKQMTESIFRQLPESLYPLFIEGDSLDESSFEVNDKIKIWGYVNYFWKEAPEFTEDNGKEKVRERRLHVVFEESGKLYRTLVERRLPLELRDPQYASLNQIQSALSRYATSIKKILEVGQLFIA